MLENLVFLHLKQQGKKVFFHKDKHECDLLTMEGNKIKEAFQVCFELHDENQEREIRGLQEAMKSHNLKDGRIITMNMEDELKMDGEKITIVPAWKWMEGKIINMQRNKLILCPCKLVHPRG